jgi:hypothetical protein
MDAFDAKRLSALEDENAKLKRPLAEQMLDAAALRDARAAAVNHAHSGKRARLHHGPAMGLAKKSAMHDAVFSSIDAVWSICERAISLYLKERRSRAQKPRFATSWAVRVWCSTISRQASPCAALMARSVDRALAL